MSFRAKGEIFVKDTNYSFEIFINVSYTNSKYIISEFSLSTLSRLRSK